MMRRLGVGSLLVLYPEISHSTFSLPYWPERRVLATPTALKYQYLGVSTKATFPFRLQHSRGIDTTTPPPP